MDISIQDLIKPKFSPGQTVFHITRDYNQRVTSITPRRIEQVVFSVYITHEKGVEKRNAKLSYYFLNSVEAHESSIVASLNDLPEADRKAVI
ncbi:hypothetical protein [Paraburkholderia sacchari]|uniref:hypothetical protein n=1 Tax=Paraburkholderia sacchari TaxID=159450 RepID=UPI001BCE37C3|nr:hypothetical protein [Paraburkholderia sacchari]